jgi:hypothetical protein
MNFRSLLLILVFTAPDHAVGAEQWANPQGSKEIKLVKEESSAGGLQKLVVNGESLQILANSNFRRENHGYGWMESAETTWIDNRFVVFQDNFGLAIVDVDRKFLLLNQAVEGYSEAPNGESWAAIRYRALNKDQESLKGNESDTLWVLDPKALAAQAGTASDESPFAHVPGVKIGGIALGPPVWSNDGKSVTVTFYSNGMILADTYDVASCKRIGSAAKKNPGISLEQMLSVRFLPEVISKIDQGLASAPTPRSSKNGPRSPGFDEASSPRKDSYDSSSALQTNDQPDLFTLLQWGTAVVLIAAVIIVLKRRQKN